MRKLVVGLFAFSLFISQINIFQANAASRYKINLTIVDEDASTNVALYDDDGDQSSAHGKKKCANAKVMWLNQNAISTSDIIKYQKVGNKTQIKIKNDSGKVVGLGTLSKVGWIKDREEMDDDPDIGLVVYGTCTYSQVITVKASDFYSLEFANTNAKITPYDISASDLKKKKWKLTLQV